MEKISSASNSKIKFVTSLQQKKFRDREKLFICEGIRLCETAIESNFEIESAFFTENLESRGLKILESIDSRKCFEVSESIFTKISETQSPQGILLVVRMKDQNFDLEKIFQRENSITIVLDSVQDPGNLGTILRTSVAADIDAIILLDGCVDLFSGKVIRSSMGAIFKLPSTIKMSRKNFIEILNRTKKIPIAASVENGINFFNVDLFESGGSILIFGNEANGVSEDLLKISKKISIPMKNSMESLNVAVSTSIILYEAMRQRDFSE